MPILASETFPDENAWRLALGGFVWRMGQLEFLTFEWCRRLDGNGRRDNAIAERGFSGRYKLVVTAITSSDWDEDKKTKALRLWRKAKCFSVFRNKIAHAPVLKIRGVSAMLDARCLMGDGRRRVWVYRPEFIDMVADHIQRLAQSLDSFLDTP